MALLEMTIKRDKYKRESLILDSLIFEKMHQFEVWKSKFDIKPTLNLPSMKAISDVYGYTSGISIREPKSTALLLENAYGAEGGNGVTVPPTKITIPTNLFKANRNFVEFKQKYIRAHSSILSDFFLNTLATVPFEKHIIHSSKQGEKAAHYREVMRKVFHEMERKASLDTNFIDKSLYNLIRILNYRLIRYLLDVLVPFAKVNLSNLLASPCHPMFRACLWPSSMNLAPRFLAPRKFLILVIQMYII